MMDLDLKEIKNAQRKASEKALRLNRALGLPYIETNNANLIAVDAEGKKTLIGEARFGLRKVSRKSFKLDGQ